MIRDWPIINREPAGDYGIFAVIQKKVRSPRTGEIREVQALQLPDWVLVLALTPEKEVIMVRQYRHGIERTCLELPGGLVDPADGSPAISARRELLEETGYQPDEIVLMGECYPQPAILNNKCFFYLAQNVAKSRTRQLDAGEDIEIIKVPLKDIPAKIESLEIDHGMVILAFSFLWLKQGREKETNG